MTASSPALAHPTAALLAGLALHLLAPALAVLPADAGWVVAAQSSDGRTGTLVVLNKGEATATFLDVASGEVVATVATGPSPHELAVSSGGRVAVGTDYGGNTLTVLDVAGTAVAGTIDLGEYDRPHGIVYLPGDTLVAVTSESTRNVVLAHVEDRRVVQVIPTGAGGSHMVAATADGSALFTGNMADATVSRLDVGTGERAESWPVPPTPEAITVSGDGREVWVGSNDEGLVSVLDTSTGRVASPLRGFGWPYRILLVPERGLVVIPDLRREEVRFVDLESREELERLELPGAGPQGVALTADRGTLFLSLSRQGRVAVIDLESREVVRTLETGPTPDGVVWSPLVVTGGGR